MGGLRQFIRGLRQRAGVSVGILLVAVVAAAAATTGPTYDAAARTSVMRDALDTPTVIDRTVEASGSGPASGLASGLATQAGGVLAAHLGGPAQLSRLFQPPVEDTLVQVPATRVVNPGASTPSNVINLSWHSGQCTNLRITTGTCPTQPGQVMISQSFAAALHLKPGDTLGTRVAALATLRVTGVYMVPSAADVASAYWLDGACADFSYEHSCTTGGSSADAAPAQPDGLFTPADTFNGLPATVQGQAATWWVLSPDGVRPGDLATLTTAVNEFLNDPGLQAAFDTTSSSIPQLTAQVTSDWGTLDVPVYLVTGQLLLLAWLLLFLIATDAAEARASEVALARLRGYGRARTAAFGISEPAALLVIGFPAGALAGWAFTSLLSSVLLRPGTPTVLPWLGIAAAAAATLGGLIAVLLAARRALTRPITEQWRRTARDAARRGWVLDGVLLTGAAAGLAELSAGGFATGARSGALSLLVPGLLGLAAAVVASRLLPAACVLAFAVTRRRGGTAVFLAVRHIARRTSGTRTTIAVATAFSLATFAIAGYAVGQRNIERVAAAQAGADGVLTVQAPQGQDLGAIVNRIDPGGTQAAAVDVSSGAGNGTVLLAVQPARFARVAAWRPGFLSTRQSPAALAARLSPPTAPPIQIPATATALRVRVGNVSGVQPGSVLTFWVSDISPGTGGGQTPQPTGPLPTGHGGLVAAALSGCPCELTMLSINAPPGASPPALASGAVTLSDLSIKVHGTWASLAGAFDAPQTAWSAGAEAPGPSCDATTGTLAPGSAAENNAAENNAAGIRWSFRVNGGCSAALTRDDVPNPVPALVSAGVTTGSGPVSALGLDGRNLTIAPVALAAAVPGAPGDGIVVDRTLALRAGYYQESGSVTEQVWTAPGALTSIRAKLAAAGVAITSVATIGQAETILNRQGPALASVLFVAAAGSAALLAAGAAVLGLYQAGRRRRHEYAALIAGRVSRRSLRASVLIEQLVVLGFGTLTGIAAGLAAAAAVLPDVPEFRSPPTSPPLLYSPPPVPVGVPLLVAAAIMGLAATVAALAVVASARPELLRQAQA
jgi:putative ABC transport system permease protein